MRHLRLWWQAGRTASPFITLLSVSPSPAPRLVSRGLNKPPQARWLKQRTFIIS